jgi:hypothetical protein
LGVADAFLTSSSFRRILLLRVKIVDREAW